MQFPVAGFDFDLDSDSDSNLDSDFASDFMLSDRNGTSRRLQSLGMRSPTALLAGSTAISVEELRKATVKFQADRRIQDFFWQAVEKMTEEVQHSATVMSSPR